MSPVFLTLPTSEKTFVPELFSVPTPVNHSPPLEITTGILHQVSTLLIFVGIPYKPFSAGYGGRGDGLPDLPSIL